MSMGHNDFFGNNTLIGYSYYYFLQSSLFQEKTKLSNKIRDKGGIVTFSITNTSIIVINGLSDIDSLQCLPIENKQRNIFVYFNNHSEIIIRYIGCIEPPIKCILYRDLLETIEAMKIDNLIDEHYKSGLPRGIDIDGLISVIMVKGDSKKLAYYQFNKIEKIKNSNIMIYEIPEYYRNAPDGFSIFCSISEKNEIDKHMRNKNSKKKTLLVKKEEEKITLALPEPRKENFYCQLCKRKYLNYYEHLNSTSHKNQQTENSFLYQRIDKSFERLRSYKNELNRKINIKVQKKETKKPEENISLYHNMTLNTNPTLNPLSTTLITTNNHNDAMSNNNSNSTMAHTFLFQEQKIIDNQSFEKLLNSKILNDINNNINKWNKKKKYDDWIISETKKSSSKHKSATRRYEPKLMQKITKCILKIQQKQLKINQ